MHVRQERQRVRSPPLEERPAEERLAVGELGLRGGALIEPSGGRKRRHARRGREPRPGDDDDAAPALCGLEERGEASVVRRGRVVGVGVGGVEVAAVIVF